MSLLQKLAPKLDPKMIGSLGAALLLLASQAQAHDFWIEAAPFTGESPRIVPISLHTGNDLIGFTQPNIAEWYRDFSYVHQGKREPMPGRMGDDPAGQLPAFSPGLYLIGYENHPDFVKLEPELFKKYLIEEGLRSVLIHRATYQQEDQPGREFYRRCAKSLMRIGDAEPTLEELQYPLGYKLELFPLNSPYSDSTLKVKLLYDGKPVQDLLVIAFNRAQPKKRSLARTDSQGLAQVNIDRPGVWIVKAVHAVPYPEDNAEWESFWASLTFERP